MTIVHRNPDIESFIGRVRNLSPLMTKICTEGSCYRFYLLLKEVFPDAEAYYDKYFHVVTLIDGGFYDISGEIQPENTVKMNLVQKQRAMKRYADLRIIVHEEAV